MKKWMYIAAAAFVVVALIALLVFALAGDPTKDMKQVDLTGTWRIAANVTYGKAEIAEDEFIVIDEKTVTLYRAGEEIASSRYTLGTGSYGQELRLPERSVTYVFEKRTDDYLRLYENANAYMEAIRYPNADMSEAKIDPAAVQGNWDVVYHKKDKPDEKEGLVIGESTIENYREDALFSSSSYVWVGKDTVYTEEWGFEVQMCPLAQDEMFIIQKDSGTVWQLRRAN